MCTIRKSYKAAKTASEKGFTLVEMAIVITIVGLIIASAGTAYVQWQTWLRHNTTATNIEDAHAAIEGFLATNGRYPCPASLSAGRADGAIYGTEPTGVDSCNNVIAGNIDLAGSPAGVDIFITAGARTPDEYIDNAGTLQDGGDGPGGVLPPAPQIRIGMIPFRSLGLEEDQAFDGHRNRIYYAVTDHMTSSVGFDNGTTGAISIVDDDGNQLTNTNGNVHFMVFSAGENGAGAYTREGALVPCPAAGNAEEENCDFTAGAGDGTFRIASYSTSTGANAMDDRMTFGVANVPFFERPAGAGGPGAGDLDDGVTKSASNLGIGGVADNPTEEMDIAGVVRAQRPVDDPMTAVDESLEGGKIEASELCANASSTDCFNIEAIAGSVANGDGMQCAAGTFIVGISNNAPICGVISTGCPVGEVIVGIDNGGNAICSGTAPNPNCPTTQVPLCGANQTLAFAAHGTTRTLTAGASRSQTYTCNNGTWNAGPATGLCNCTPSAPYNDTIPCALNDNQCGPRFTGTQDIQRTDVTCPSGNSTSTIIDNSRCVCDPNSRRTVGRNCRGANSWWISFVASQPPSGYSFNTGRVNLERITQCPAATCSPWQLDNENCGCTNDVQTQNSTCTNGFSGNRTRTRNYTCVGGGGVGDYGRWGNWSAWDTTACNCDTTAVSNGLIQCHDAQAGWVPKPSGPGGIRTQTTNAVVGQACVSQTTQLDTLTAVCDPPPPVQCAWSPGGSSAPGGHPTNFAGVPGGCACGTGNAPCEQGPLRFNSCSCDPI